MAKSAKQPGTAAGAGVKRRRRAWRVPAILLALILVAGYAAADAADLAPGILTTTEPWPEAEPFPEPELPAPVSGVQPPAAADEEAPVPKASYVQKITDQLAGRDPLDGDPGAVVVDVASGKELVSRNAAEAYVPASSLKILVAMAALEVYGADHQFTTEAVGNGQGEVTLVAGGDLTLAAGEGDPDAVVGHAGLADLAEDVAASLQEQGRSSVHLALDDTLFTGPQLAPHWGDVDLSGGWAMPMAPIAVDIGQREGHRARSTDAAKDAAQAFAKALRDQGITVDGDITRAQAPEEAEQLGAVKSAELGRIVDYTLRHSENVLSETLGRMTAVGTDHEASFAGAGKAVLSVLKDLGLDVSSAELVDTSGLSSLDRVTPTLLVQALKLVTDGEHPQFLSVANGLPVAGLDGTLSGRLDDGAATGMLRAKTGTLTQAVSLSGFVTTADGRLLAFAVVANGFEVGNVGAVRGAVDKWAGALAACGCS